MKILVADDDPDFGRLVRALLEGFGHQPTIVEDGEAALEEYARSFHPVVITDWMMPRLDGLELTKRLRARRERRYPWIMMLTVRDFGENYARTMEAGVDDFLSKPIDPALLQARLRVAERVQKMIAQLGELESLLPICMHCKAIRNQQNAWQRLETYLQENKGLGFSHGYCPRCYYDREIQPDLVEMRKLRATPLKIESGLEGGAVAVLEAYAARNWHGLIEDIAESFRYSDEVDMRELLGRVERDGMLAPIERQRLERFRQQCWDLGALKLHQLLELDAATLDRLEPAARVQLVETVREELAVVERAVEQLLQAAR